MSALVPFLLLAVAGSAAPAAVTVTRLSDNVVVASADPWATNVVAVKTDDGVVVVDTHLAPSIARRCRAAIDEAFPGSELRYVIGTHYHLDHAGGNRAFEDVTIVAHDDARPLQNPAELVQWGEQSLANERKQVQEAGDATREGQAAARRAAVWEEVLADYKDPNLIVQPSLTFSDRLTLHLGESPVHLIHYGRAHSTSDILVHFPKEKVLVVSALFSHDQLPGGYVADEWDVPQWLSALDAVLSGGIPEIVVSGHGEPLSGEEIQRARDYLGRLWSAILEQRAAGRTLEQAQEQLRLESFSPALTSLGQKNWSGQDIHPRNVEAFWRCATRLND